MYRLIFSLACILWLGMAVLGCKHEPAVFDPLDLELENALLRLSPTGQLSHFQLPHADQLDQIPAGIQNELTPAKVALGQLLFFETALARDAVHPDGMNTYSCASCHVPSAGFMPGRKQGIADGAVGFGFNGEARTMLNDVYQESEIDAQGARPLSLLNTAYVTNSMWSGRFGARFNNVGTEARWSEADGTIHNQLGLDGLEAQNIEGTIVHRMRVDGYILDTLGYRQYFDEAFGDWSANERYGRLAMSFAISAYLRTLLPTEAPFQRWVRGESDALTETQKRGATLFFGKAGCYRCHQGAALNANEFHAIGVSDLYEFGGLRTGPDDNRNLGRGGFTQRAEDLYKFKVPQLYNLKNSPFYFHGSSHHSLLEVVNYFNRGLPENPRVPTSQLSPYFHPLNLNANEVRDITEFLANGLYDPQLERFMPKALPSGNCFPNNDPRSREELGCDN